jgi:predicted CoA-binding protein
MMLTFALMIAAVRLDWGFDMATRQAIDAFLANRAIALVGMSRSGGKFGNAAWRTLSSKGYRVYPIHPFATVIGHVPCYRGCASLPEPVDAVLVVVPPSEALGAVREAAAAGVHHVWLQQGAESPDVLTACRELGLNVIAGECILMFAQPTGVHNVHRWMRKLVGRLPARGADAPGGSEPSAAGVSKGV